MSPDPRLGWSFWGRWVVANIVGASISAGIGWVVVRMGPVIVSQVVLWVVIGTVMGMRQQWVLRRHIQVDNWVWASLAGWTVGGILGGYGDIDWAVIGTVVGITQWFGLRRQVQRAGWWVLASTTGLVVGGFIGGAVFLAQKSFVFREQIALAETVTDFVAWIVAGAAAGTVNGMITGPWLIWLLRSKRKDQDTNEQTRFFESFGPGSRRQ